MTCPGQASPQQAVRFSQLPPLCVACWLKRVRGLGALQLSCCYGWTTAATGAAMQRSGASSLYREKFAVALFIHPQFHPGATGAGSPPSDCCCCCCWDGAATGSECCAGSTLGGSAKREASGPRRSATTPCAALPPAGRNRSCLCPRYACHTSAQHRLYKYVSPCDGLSPTVQYLPLTRSGRLRQSTLCRSNQPQLAAPNTHVQGKGFTGGSANAPDSPSSAATRALWAPPSSPSSCSTSTNSTRCTASSRSSCGQVRARYGHRGAKEAQLRLQSAEWQMASAATKLSVQPMRSS